MTIATSTAPAHLLGSLPTPLLALFYLRMYNKDTHQTQHWLSTGSSLLSARIAVADQLGYDWWVGEHKIVMQTTESVCMFLN